MKSVLPARLRFIVGGALLIFCGLAFVFTDNSHAQSLRPEFSQSRENTVIATVGSTTLTISGFQSPYASIILKTQSGTFLASTTADANGYFSISDVLINQSELVYCFQAVDFKRVGVSESCITIPGPIVGDVVYSGVFLPPTIGLSEKRINAGADAIIFGYSMPGAIVTLNINGKNVTISADSQGYYTYTYENVPEGTFTITASATLNEENSLDPTNNVILESLSVPEQIQETGEKLTEELTKKVPKSAIALWPFFLLALALLTLIGILLYKLKFRFMIILVDFLRRKKKMHHDWFLNRW